MTFATPYQRELNAQYKARQAGYRSAAVEFERRAAMDKAAWNRIIERRAEIAKARAARDRMAAKAFVAGILQSALASPAINRDVQIKNIIKAVAHRFDLVPLDILGDRRTTNFVRPRQIAMAVAKRTTIQSFEEIGRRFNRDHSTIVHGVNKIETKIAAGDAELGKLVDSLVTEVTMAARGKHAAIR